MAIKLTDRIQANTAEGVIAEGSQVQGAFITVADKSALKPALLQEGLFVYDQATSKYWKLLNGGWTEFEIDTKVDNESIVADETTKEIKLSPTYKNFLDDLMYDHPVSTFSIEPSSCKVGETLSSIVVNHSETNISNIKKLELVIDTSTYTLTPSQTSLNETVNVNKTLLEDIVVKIKITDTRNDVSYSDSVILDTLYPSFYGFSTAETITSQSGLTEIESESLREQSLTITTTAQGYIYFASTVAINKVYSSGYEVPIMQLNSQIFTLDGGVQKEYMIYRNTVKLASGKTITVDIDSASNDTTGGVLVWQYF